MIKFAKLGKYNYSTFINNPFKNEVSKLLKIFFKEKGYNIKISEYEEHNFFMLDWSSNTDDILDNNDKIISKNKKNIEIKSNKKYDQCMLKIKEELTPSSFNAFFESLKVSKENNVLKIIAPNDFIKGILEARYMKMIQAAYNVDEIKIYLEDKNEN